MNERDPELDKLYRDHAREEPPSALDAKILAAAHQAVASGPRKVGEATRPQRWWMPLAAAAVIGVVAVGIVQQMPKEPAIDTTSVAPAPARAPVDAPPPAAAESKQKPKEADEPAPPPPAPPPPAVPKPAAKAATGSDRKLAAEPVPFPAAPPPPVVAPAPAAAPAPAPAQMPQKTEVTSAEAKRDAPAEQAFADSRKDNAARAERQAPMSAAAPAPAPAAAPPMAARMRAQGESAGAVAQLGKSVQNEMQELARDPDAWIVRIRKLRDEGNTAQALRELREFRALVPDAEKRLPPDLKSLQP